MADPNIPPPPPGFTVDTQGPVYGAPPSTPPPPSGYAPAGQPVKPLTYVPGGPHDPTATPAPPSGFRYTHGGRLEPIPGGPADKTASGDQLSPDALNAETTNWILTGKMSPLGMGNGPLRVQIENQRPLIMKQNGITDNALPAIQQQFSADAKAYSQRTQQLSFMQQAKDAAVEHVKQISGYLDDLPAQTSLTPINAVTLGAERMASGKTVTDLDATIPLLQAEVAKIMTANPSGSGQLTDEARSEFAILNSSRSPAARKEAALAIMEMVDRKITGTQSEADRLNQRLNGGLASYAHLGAAPPSGPQGGNPSGAPPALPNDPVTPATGQTKDVIDPAMTPVRQGYLARLQAGQSGAQLVSFLRQSGVTNQGLLNSAVAQAAFRRKYPDVPIGKYGTDQIDHTTVQMGMANRAVNAIGQTGVGAGAIAAGNAALGGYGPDILGALGGNEAQARLAGQYSAQNHPGATLTGEIAGGTLATMGGEAALARGAGMAPGVVRSLVANSLYGGIAGSGATPDNRLGGAAMGAAAGAGGSLLGEVAARVGSKALGGLAGTDASALLNSGVPLTIGQAVGGAAKSLEDKAMSYVPGIAARRAEGIRVFNAKAINKALEPIGATGSGETGSEGIAQAQAAVKGAFDTALKGKVAVPDKPFIDEARGALGRLATIRRNDLGSEIVGQIEGATKDLFDPSTGALSGENMQTFLESMRQIRQDYRNDPLSRRVITPSIRQIERATEDMFGRQAPEVVPAFNAAKTAYRRVSVLADAVNSAENTNGVYTAAQLGQAARANAKKYDGAMSAAANRSDLRQFQREAQNVLPSAIPDSGTAGRAALAAVPAALAGGAGGYELGGHDGAATGIGIVGALSLLYSRRGQSALIGAAVKRDGVDRAIARALDKYRAVGAAAGGATGVSTTASPPGAIPYP